MGEDHRYMMIVIGSNPIVATRVVRNSIGSEYRSFTPGVVSSSLTGPTWMNSSTAERPVVSGRAESSNLSSSAMWVRRRWRVVAVCNTVAFGFSWFESSHSHKGESPVGRGSCLENSCLPEGGSGVRFPLSPQNYMES